MIVPHDQLSPEALAGVIEECVTRDGTDLADAPAKAEAVRRGLASGRLVLVFDPGSGSCGIARREDAVGPEGQDLTADDGPEPA